MRSIFYRESDITRYYSSDSVIMVYDLYEDALLWFRNNKSADKHVSCSDSAAFVSLPRIARLDISQSQLTLVRYLGRVVVH